LSVLELGVGAQDSAEAVVGNLLLIGHHKVPPPGLAFLALHLILVDGLGRVEFGEVLLQVLEDLVVEFSEAQCRALDLLEDGPVGLQVLNDYIRKSPSLAALNAF
jgi:hypothetical protein